MATNEIYLYSCRCGSFSVTVPMGCSNGSLGFARFLHLVSGSIVDGRRQESGKDV